MTRTGTTALTLSEEIRQRFDEFSRSQKDVGQYIVEALANLLGQGEGGRSGTRHERGFRRNLCSSFQGAVSAAHRSLSRTASL